MRVMLNALGYLGFHADNIDDWAGYGAQFLGLQLADRSTGSLAFRMDDRKQRLLIHGGADRRPVFGWEVANAAALAALGAVLERAAVPFARMDHAMAAQRRVAAGLTFQDPGGNRLEAFYGGEIATDPFMPGRSHSGFKTGPLGLGHIVLNTTAIDADLAFYTQILGFKLSDYVTKPFRAMFFHTNARHHSLALIEWPTQSIHHLMLEMFSLDDVGQGYDLALREPGRIATTLGRHTNDFMTSFYSNSPSGFLVESGWGGRTIDPAHWEPFEVVEGPSLWGHDRNWLPADKREQAAQMRMQAARDNVRAPVQVTPGNFQIAAGACPWWDGIASAREQER
jgi:2,3-dihydroxybiphenyl 1,2-dioxygenase